MDWRKEYADKIVPTAAEAVSIINSGEFVVFQQTHSEPHHLVKALVDRAPELRDVRLMCHSHYGPADYGNPENQKSFKPISQFADKNVRTHIREGRVDFLPLFYYQMPNWYREVGKPDVFMMMAAPPDENGRCSFGLDVDYTVACFETAKKVIVQINDQMPYTHGSYFSLNDVTAVWEHSEPLSEKAMGNAPGPIETKMAEYIAPLIPDGATLQLGIGGVPDAVLGFLKDKKDLGIHSELFSDGIVDLYHAGVVTNKKKTLYPGKFVANFLIGTKKLFDFVDNNEDVMMLPVDITNDPVTIAKNDNMISINSCIMVDLYGQVVSDTIGGRQYSGVGGQVDFVRGAQMSKGGKSVLTVKSTALKGTVSNIVPQLPPGSLVTTSRFDTQYVCSEYGIVNLNGMTSQQRAAALIGIAHPSFREELTAEARKMGLWVD